MITLTKEQLREVQLTELEMLRELHRICQAEDIPYVIIAGTLLGAVRHRGFIPWDDDVDVAMLRPDYERFRKACLTQLDRTRFVFQDDRRTPGYLWGYGKLRRKNTLFLREHQESMPYFQGIFIDVFPLDEVPASPAGRALWDAACFFIRKCMWARVGKNADKSAVKRFAYLLLDRIPEDTRRAWYHSLIRKSRTISARSDAQPACDPRKRAVRILLFPTPEGTTAYQRQWYTDRGIYEFEGEAFFGIQSADDYLRFKFGNYWEIPPESERKTHPVTMLRLLSDTNARRGETGMPARETQEKNSK